MTDVSEETDIDFVRKNEGYIYGSGAADLLVKIKERLEKEFPNGKCDKPKDAALAIYGVLRRASEATGQDPRCETFLREEGNEGRMTYTVGWESGPYDWAIQGSFVVINATGRLCEPYYGFDLCLYDVE